MEQYTILSRRWRISLRNKIWFKIHRREVWAKSVIIWMASGKVFPRLIKLKSLTSQASYSNFAICASTTYSCVRCYHNSRSIKKHSTTECSHLSTVKSWSGIPIFFVKAISLNCSKVPPKSSKVRCLVKYLTMLKKMKNCLTYWSQIVNRFSESSKQDLINLISKIISTTASKSSTRISVRQTLVLNFCTSCKIYFLLSTTAIMLSQLNKQKVNLKKEPLPKSQEHQATTTRHSRITTYTQKKSLLMNSKSPGSEMKRRPRWLKDENQ